MKSVAFRVVPRVQAMWPVATAKELISTRVPWRMYACSRRSRRPGWAGLVGVLRSSTVSDHRGLPCRDQCITPLFLG